MGGPFNTSLSSYISFQSIRLLQHKFKLYLRTGAVLVSFGSMISPSLMTTETKQVPLIYS